MARNNRSSRTAPTETMPEAEAPVETPAAETPAETPEAEAPEAETPEAETPTETPEAETPAETPEAEPEVEEPAPIDYEGWFQMQPGHWFKIGRMRINPGDIIYGPSIQRFFLEILAEPVPPLRPCLVQVDAPVEE